MPRYTEQQAREAVASSLCYADAMRKVGLAVAGGNHKLFRHWVDDEWAIPTDHFESAQKRMAKLHPFEAVPLETVMTESSSYSRSSLKKRLYADGLKEPICEICGQGEVWRERRLAMILDHINGVRDDHRLENLRILCPNCNATLDTHCGRKNLRPPTPCLRCGTLFRAKGRKQKYCSTDCGMRGPGPTGKPRVGARKVARPTYDLLLRDAKAMPMVHVGHKYCVSDNAVRKWITTYERDDASRGLNDRLALATSLVGAIRSEILTLS